MGTTTARAGAASVSTKGLNKIKHIVLLMQENRSADTYFGQLHSEGQPAFSREPAKGNPNPLDADGPRIRPFHKPTLCETSDLNHSWNGAHQEWDHGKMDGFTAANDVASGNADPSDPAGSRTMGYYNQTDLPFYYSLYNTFATGDRYFSSVLGPTFPNRFYLLAGTSFGHIANDFPASGGFTQPSIFNLLDRARVSWKIYFSQVPFALLFSYVQQHAAGHLVPISQFSVDAKAGTLPQVSFVDPIFSGPPNVENDEHPPVNVQVGQRFTYGVINDLEHSPNWTSSALFLTYDESGGFYDHVPPPAAVAPDRIPPMLTLGDVAGAFNRYGFRVPVVVVSPFARAHYVSHVVHDHTSILRFIEMRFGLPALTARDAAANPMLEFFSFKHPPFVTPPAFNQPPVTLC
jgi:phospholipase C